MIPAMISTTAENVSRLNASPESPAFGLHYVSLISS
jgi:hypothetical protein